MILPSSIRMAKRSVIVVATAMLFSIPAAEAAVVSVSFAGAPIVVPNDIDGVYFNFVTGTYSPFEMPGYDFNPYNNLGGLAFYGAGKPSGIMGPSTTGPVPKASVLKFGDLISSAAEFNEYQSVAYDFNITGQEYVGLRFMNEDTGILNYGWALMSTTYNTSPNRGFDAFVLA